MNKEIWKDIPGYEGLYQASILGRIRRLNYRNTGKYKILKPSIKTTGYLQVGLYKNQHCKLYLVHRLIAKTFIPNPDNKLYINHIDENRTNNKVDNLEWCTMTENNNHGNRNKKARKTFRKNHGKRVGCFINNKLIKMYYCLCDVKLDNFSEPSVWKCCNGRRKKHKGYEWKYITDE